MNKTKLLENAAKAINCSIEWDGSTANLYDPILDSLRLNWDPEHNDSDAMKLIVALKMDIEFWEEQVYVESWITNEDCTMISEHESLFACDPQAALRMAILKNASEYGKYILMEA